MKYLPALLLSAFFVLTEPLLTSATTYNFALEYSGADFFDPWTFYNNYDNLTEGDVNFVSASEAAEYQLAYVDSSTGHAIIKVDNTTNVPYNDKRNSVRITSNDSFGIGSLWVMDAYHLPYGCSVWPSFFSFAPNWPVGGEIDTLEGVNMMTENMMSLHTEPGCTQSSPNETSTIVNSTDCSYTNNDQGCIVTDPSTSSYGAGFASDEGGAFVTELASDGINIWFFPRSQIPSSLSSNSSSVDTSTFGIPVGNWPNTGCNIDEFFQAQNLVLVITLCGEFAGDASIFNETCTGVCYNDYVIGSPSYYDTAYFEISYIRAFSAQGTDTVSSTSASGTATGTSAASSTGSTGSSTNTSGAAGMVQGGVWAVVAVLAAMVATYI